MKNVNCNILSAPDSANATGSTVDSNQLISASFQAYFGDSTAAGTFVIQASNDEYGVGYLPANFTPTNWTNIPNATATIVAGASAIISIDTLHYRWVRAIFTGSAGTTTINVNMFAVSM